MSELKEIDAEKLDDRPERWRAVSGFEGAYDVSDFGRVRSLATRDKYGTERPRQHPLVLKLSWSGRYVQVTMKRGDLKKSANVHVLVAETFLGSRPLNHQCAHLDGDGSNNHISNLMWVTASENALHKRGHGTMAAGEKNGQAKLSDSQVLDIRRRYRKGRGADLASQHGVSLSVVVAIGRGKTWTHL